MEKNEKEGGRVGYFLDCGLLVFYSFLSLFFLPPGAGFLIAFLSCVSVICCGYAVRKKALRLILYILFGFLGLAVPEIFIFYPCLFYLLFHEKMRGLAAVAVMFFLWKIPESRENMGLFAMTGVFGFLLEPSVVAAILHKEKYEMYQVNVLICWISPLNQAVYGKHNFGYDPLLPTIWQSCMFFAGILFVLMVLALRRMKKYPFEFLGEKT